MKLFSRLFQNIRINSSLIYQVCIFTLCIDNDRRLQESIHSHIIGVTFGVTFFLFPLCHDYDDCLLKLLTGQWCIVTIIMVN